MNIDRVLNEEISLESLLDGHIETNKERRSRDTRNKLNFVLNTNKDFKKCIKDSYSDEYTNGVESILLYNEAIQYGNFATESINNFKKDMKLLKNIDKKFGIESENDVGVKKLSIFKKIWNAIINAFQKLIASAANFIKSVEAWMAKASQSATLSKFENHIDDVKEIISTFENKSSRIRGIIIKFYPIKINAGLIYKNMEENAKKLSSLPVEVSNNLKKITNEFVDTIKNNKVFFSDDKTKKEKIFSFLKTKILKYKNPKETFDKLITNMEEVLFINKQVVEHMKKMGGGKIKLTEPSKVVKYVIYGSDKPIMQTYNVEDLSSTLIKKIPFDVLHPKYFNILKNYNNANKYFIKSMNILFKDIRVSLKEADEILNQMVKSKNNNPILQECIKTITDYNQYSRQIMTFSMGLHLSWYREIIKLREAPIKVIKLFLSLKKNDNKDKK